MKWDCPITGCGHGIETTGRDESSRLAVTAFKREHTKYHEGNRDEH